MLTAAMQTWETRLNDAAQARDFLELLPQVWDVAVYLHLFIRENRVLLEQGLHHARRIGDSRNQLLLECAQCIGAFYSGNMAFNKSNNLDLAVQRLHQFGDEELYSRVGDFLHVTRHFIKGEMAEAVESYEARRQNGIPRLLPYLEQQMPLLAASAAAYHGDFPFALGVLRAIIRAERGRHSLACLFYQHHLGCVLLLMRKYSEARKQFRQVLAETTFDDNPKLVIRLLVCQAYALMQENRADEAYQTLLAAVEFNRHIQAVFTPTFNYPWMAELLDGLTTRGFAALDGFDCALFQKNLLNSPSLLHRGFGLRLAARQLFETDPDTARVRLEEAMDCFRKAGASAELAFTEQAKAELLRRQGQIREARAADERAAEQLRGCGLLETARRSPAPGENEWLPAACQEQLIRLPAWRTAEELADRLCRMVRGLLASERAALLRDVERAPRYAGGCNLRREDLDEAFFQDAAPALRQVVDGQPLWTEMAAGTALWLPLRLSPTELWALYADGEYPLTVCANPQSLRQLARLLAVVLHTAHNGPATPGNAAPRTDISNANRNVPLCEGNSPAFRACLERARIVASTDAPILLLGETGVGKELIANAIHRMSGTSGPFVVVHPASISEQLFESEFFGHEKGAFTGAIRQKIGLVELADGGTLFIDEMGDVPLSMQIKLLRVLQEHTFLRVGGIRELRSSFRLISATNKNLFEAVRGKAFREDLYYRISVIPLEIPPLRERREDIQVLLQLFLDFFARRYGKSLPAPNSDTLAALLAYPWPGNVRELRNCVERAVILYTDGPLQLSIGATRNATSPAPCAEGSLYADLPSLEELQRRYILYMLRRSGGKVCGPDGAEHALQMKRSTLYQKLKEYGIPRRPPLAF